MIRKNTKTEIKSICVSNKKSLQERMELTGEGWRFCIMAGILETVSVLTVLRIDLLYVPVLVFLVLWAAFGILTSAFLAGTGYYLVYRRSLKPELCTVVKYEPFRRTEQKAVWNVKKAS